MPKIRPDENHGEHREHGERPMFSSSPCAPCPPWLKRCVRGRFNWQEGFGGFSYRHSQLATVIRYIQNQAQHHQQRSFKSEYLTLLRKFDLAFREEYVFDFIEDQEATPDGARD